MKKHNLLIILAVLLLTCSLSVAADELPETKVLTIENAEQFMEFAENCRLDSYSANLTVSLQADIDLSQQAFDGIPIFCGTFNGNGHTISGVDLQVQSSAVGLFRYLTETAAVSDLTVSGTVHPSGSAAYVGGIVGSNAGSIKNCSFSGNVAGTDQIGGIAGYNTATGVIDSCFSEGFVYGDHFVGGIVGGNSGIIQNCTNAAKVNTDPQQNDVELSDITIESLTGTESAGTVTDIGGIAGISSGYIRSCKNNADIGYKHIGYNIGGIAGSQTGYMADCLNIGTISGRKEVGGIIGQLEPALAITYSTDTLQILQEQLNTLSVLTNNAASNFGYAADGIKDQFVLIQGQIENAISTFEGLIPEEDTQAPVPDMESVSDAVDSLQQSLTTIGESLENIYGYIEYADSALSKDFQAISNAVAAMQQTINGASENLGGSVSDLSDEDTDEILSAKVQRCQNEGTVYADLNGGGIAGAIALENDLDPESDVEIYGESTLNFAGTYRAVITDCDNSGAVTVKKQYGGGIVGYATLGLIRSCTNTADMVCPDAVYIGGIAGRSDGYIRSCSAKCQITAKEYAGGIAGHAQTVSDCRSLSLIRASEKTGAVLGYAKELSGITGNYYLPVSNDIGAVDGISYETAAQPLTAKDFLLLEDLPELFQSYCVTFIFADGTKQEVPLKTGEYPAEEQIPQLPEIDGCKGNWIGLDDVNFFDTVINSSYETRLQVVQSDDLRSNGLPVLLAEGSFTRAYQLELTQVVEPVAEKAIEAWSFQNSGITKLRYLPPEDYPAEDLCVMIYTEDGTWQQVSHTIEGSYIVFAPGEGNDRFSIVPVEKSPLGLYIAAGSTFLIVAIVVMVIVFRRKKAAKNAPENSVAEQ